MHALLSIIVKCIAVKRMNKTIYLSISSIPGHTESLDYSLRSGALVMIDEGPVF